MTYGVFSGDTTTQSPQNLGFAHQMSPALMSTDSSLDLEMDTFSGGALTDGNIHVLTLLEKMCLLQSVNLDLTELIGNHSSEKKK